MSRGHRDKQQPSEEISPACSPLPTPIYTLKGCQSYLFKGQIWSSHFLPHSEIVYEKCERSSTILDNTTHHHLLKQNCLIIQFTLKYIPIVNFQRLQRSPSPVLSRVCVHTQLSPTFCNPRDCSPPGSSVHGIFQARILKWVAISYSKGSSWHRDQTGVSCVFCIDRQILYHWATWEASL